MTVVRRDPFSFTLKITQEKTVDGGVGAWGVRVSPMKAAGGPPRDVLCLFSLVRGDTVLRAY